MKCTTVFIFSTAVMYQPVVSGQTFNADKQLMEQIEAKVKDLVQLTPDSQDSKVVILFCPISSRVGTDVYAAMTHVPGMIFLLSMVSIFSCLSVSMNLKDSFSTDGKDVILVLMNFTREVKAATSIRASEYRNVVLHVNVFYHDTMHGLLKCQENTDAVCEIQKKLLEYSVTKTKYIRDNDCDMITESRRTGSVSRKGKDQGSSTDTANSHGGKSKRGYFW